MNSTRSSPLLASVLALAAGCGGGSPGPETLLIDIAPAFLTTDGTSLIWSETYGPPGGPIKRVPKDHISAANVEVLGTGYQPVVVGGAVYATTESLGDNTTTLYRYPPLGNTPTVATYSGFGSNLAADDQNVYLSTTDPGPYTSKIWAQPIDGSAATLLATDLEGQAYEMAAGQGEVYWISDRSRTTTAAGPGSGGAVMKVSAGGGSPTTIFAGPSRPTGLALDSQNVYWAADQQLSKQDRSTGAATALAATGNAVSIVVDATSVYWVERPLEVRRVPSAGGPAVTLARTEDANSVAVDDQYVYWTTWIDTSHGSLTRLPKQPAP